MSETTGASSGGSGRQPSYDELSATVAVLRAENMRLRGDNDELRAQLAGLEAVVDELRRAGKRQSAPFSKRPPKENPATPGRKAGEDYGTHASRKIPERIDETLDAATPEACPDCGGELDVERVADQYVEDLPETTTVVSRIRIPVCRCRRCGRRVQGRHPAQVSDALGAAGSQVGPRAASLAVELHHGGGLSLAKTSAVLGRLGLSVTPGGVCGALARIARRAEPTYEALRAELAASPVVSPDETGWRIGGLRAWLWVFATVNLTLYHLARGRGFAQATEVLPADYAGTLCRDGWAVYRGYDNATHQSCLAHLVRRCKELCETLPEADRKIPADTAEILTTALAVRDARDRGELNAEQLVEAVTVADDCIATLLRRPARHDTNRRLLGHLRRERYGLFSFLADPAVDATNWRAEQGVRPAVVNRKVWGGNRTDVGARTQEILMSVLRTAAQQGHDAISLFTELLRSPVPIVASLDLPLTRPRRADRYPSTISGKRFLKPSAIPLPITPRC